ncbi:MAG: UDP-3-O-acyl-N-acetylglucosamine deacetylase [Mariniblastus sp.]|nr:UDP-3-O-acyl-N-acetylglucosamine deacetylase [Mariniblastus sp.]
MDRPRQQTTITDEVSVSGFGFWSGRDVNLTFVPARADTGVVFVRSDLPNHPRIPAVIQNRVNGPRRTTLVSHGTPVEMVEHVLAALAGMQIDNCEVHVNRAEMPGGDGSSLAFTNALSKTKIVELDQQRRVIRVNHTFRVGNEDSWIQAEPNSVDELDLTYNLNYACPAIGTQSYQSVITPQIFVSQISSARTFVLVEEAEQLKKQGLGKRVTYQDVIVFDDNGPIDNPLRFEDECARHKLLDMVGDFSLSGADLIGKITAHRSGHRLNSQLVFGLLQQIVQSLPSRLSA